jgi:small subunit ribosomal protein S8
LPKIWVLENIEVKNMRHDLLADVLSMIKNAEFTGLGKCTAPASNLVKEVLKVMQSHGYIGEFEFVDDGRGGKFNISLLGNINKCGVIKPRFSVKLTEYEKYEKRYLPARDFGILIVTTPKGIMSHREAKEKATGGKLLAYVY